MGFDLSSSRPPPPPLPSPEDVESEESSMSPGWLHLESGCVHSQQQLRLIFHLDSDSVSWCGLVHSISLGLQHCRGPSKH